MYSNFSQSGGSARKKTLSSSDESDIEEELEDISSSETSEDEEEEGDENEDDDEDNEGMSQDDTEVIVDPEGHDRDQSSTTGGAADNQGLPPLKNVDLQCHQEAQICPGRSRGTRRQNQRAPPNSKMTKVGASGGTQVRNPPSSSKVAVSKIPIGKKLSPSEARKIYSELIDSCIGCDEKEGVEGDLEALVGDNILKWNDLFNQIGAQPGDMYMAFLHTKTCSNMLRNKAQNIGNTSTGFKLEEFLDNAMENLKGWRMDSGYDPLNALACYSEISAACCTTAPTLTALVGTYDREELMAAKEIIKPKRAETRRKKFDENLDQETRHEVIEAVSTHTDKSGPEVLSQKILTGLQKYHSKNKAPINIFNFSVDKGSLLNSVAHAFYVGFLIREGRIHLSKTTPKNKKLSQDQRGGELVIKPVRPPEKEPLNSDAVMRKQYIFSFNAKIWKALVQKAKGENVITDSKK